MPNHDRVALHNGSPGCLAASVTTLAYDCLIQTVPLCYPLSRLATIYQWVLHFVLDSQILRHGEPLHIRSRIEAQELFPCIVVCGAGAKITDPRLFIIIQSGNKL